MWKKKERRAVEEQMDEFAKQRQTKGSRPGAAGNTAGGGGFAKETGHPEDLTEVASARALAAARADSKRRKRSYVPVKGNVIMGSAVRRSVFIHRTGRNSESGVVCIEGELFNKDSRTTKSDSKLATLFVTDKRTSICIKAFVVNE